MNLLDYQFVQESCRQISWKKNVRSIIAVAFLVLLLIEWGSHNLAFAHGYSADDDSIAVQSQTDTHEDACKTLIRCSDGPRQDRQALKLGHDAQQYNNFLNDLLTTPRLSELPKDPRLRRRLVQVLFRPSDPLFRPPKIS